MRDQRISRTCQLEACGATFLIKRSRIANGRGLFCSLACKRATGYDGKLCLVDGCESPAWNRGWCRLHHQRWFRTGSPTGSTRRSAEERFWSRVEKNGPIPRHRPELGPCWLWLGPLNNGGYGSIWDGAKGVGAHVFAYRLLVGPLADGQEPDHLCSLRHCVNAPAHLESVTHQENLRRGNMGQYRKAWTHCPRGHPFDEANTFFTRDGRRGCRACRTERSRARTVARVR